MQSKLCNVSIFLKVSVSLQNAVPYYYLIGSWINTLESNMASGGHITFEKCKNNPRNEFPTSILCKIDPLHTFQPFVLQKLILALNQIWRPAAILDLGHFPGSDWWGFLGCHYWSTKAMKSAGKPFVRIFSTLSITMGLDWLG